MHHKACYEALDRTLRDIKKKPSLPMGGIPVLLCGDFRQILPVVKGGTRPNVVNACLKKSYLWEHVIVFHLETNMRVALNNDPEQANFSEKLMCIGNGKVPIIDHPDIIEIPDGMCQKVDSMDELHQKVFPTITESPNHALDDRVILCALNARVNIHNNILYEKFESETEADERCYKSIDTVVNDGDEMDYPTELLNSIDISGLPPHLLKLKVGCPVIVLRNLDPPKIVNGTRATVNKLYDNAIEIIIMSSSFKVENFLLPRIPIIPTDVDLPFELKRLQFPVKLCFAMTVHKAQGQTFKTVGLDLMSPCFSHGQLYVAMSRTGNPKEMFSLFQNAKSTRNIVYSEVLEAE